jgi:hypothetical protein
MDFLRPIRATAFDKAFPTIHELAAILRGRVGTCQELFERLTIKL